MVRHRRGRVGDERNVLRRPGTRRAPSRSRSRTRLTAWRYLRGCGAVRHRPQPCSHRVPPVAGCARSGAIGGGSCSAGCSATVLRLTPNLRETSLAERPPVRVPRTRPRIETAITVRRNVSGGSLPVTVVAQFSVMRWRWLNSH